MNTALALSGVSIILIRRRNRIPLTQYQLITSRTLPCPELLLHDPANLGRIEIAYDRQLRVGCAEELIVEILHIRQRQLFSVGDILFEGADSPRIALRIADQMAAQCQRSQRARLFHAAFRAAQLCLPQLLEFAFYEGRLPHYFRSQTQRRDQARANRRNVQTRIVIRCVRVHLRLQCVQLVLQLLPRMLLSPAHQHGAREFCGSALVEYALLIAVM